MSERSQRINKAISESGLSYGDLSKITGIPKSALQRYATGETEKVPSDRIELIAEATQVKAEFLLWGWLGEQLASVYDDVLDEREHTHIVKYRRLNDANRQAVDIMINSLLESEKRGVVTTKKAQQWSRK